MQKRIFYPLVLIGFCFTLLSVGIVDLNSLFNYQNQGKPSYITKDNTPSDNSIDDKIATLGRVLFYDKSLSLNNTISCGSCHIQEFAFGDTAVLSRGITGGLTGRHSMRLVNSRFGTEVKFFWDERAGSLEIQTTQPIQDHVEMGFSNANGQPGIDSLINRLASLPYYQSLFEFAYGNSQIDEAKIQKALAQFIRSIQSFDSKFDQGRILVANDAQNFPNYTTQENLGKQLFLAPPPNGGAGCQGCHRAPEFDIDPASLNNGVIGVAGSTNIDLMNTRAPSLRNLFNAAGELNGPLMHNGVFTTIEQVINHYNLVPQNPQNTNLDPRLQGPGGNLQLTQNEKDALVAFLKTLSGTAVYADERWSNPFDSNNNLEVILPAGSLISYASNPSVQIFPNPVADNLFFKIPSGSYSVQIMDLSGRVVIDETSVHQFISVSHLKPGTYVITFKEINSKSMYKSKFIKK
jgi:cytochrome c peroxidase